MPEGSTTPDHAALTRRSFEGASRHDLDTSMSSFTPETVWDLSNLGLGTFEGVAAIRRFVEEWWGTWSEHLVEILEVVDLSHGVVFASVREDGRLRGSEGHVEHLGGWIFLRTGETAERVMVYLDSAHARSVAEQLAVSRR